MSNNKEQKHEDEDDDRDPIVTAVDLRNDIATHRMQRDKEVFLKSIFRFVARKLKIKKWYYAPIFALYCIDDSAVESMIKNYDKFTIWQSEDSRKSIELAILQVVDDYCVETSIEEIDKVVKEAQAKWDAESKRFVISNYF